MSVWSLHTELILHITIPRIMGVSAGLVGQSLGTAQGNYMGCAASCTARKAVHQSILTFGGDWHRRAESQ